MKKCPHCHKSIGTKAKICPFCGQAIEKDRHYNKTKKRVKKPSSWIYIIIAFVFMFSPLVIGFLIDTNDFITVPSRTKENKIKLGPLGDVKKDREYESFHFSDLQAFEKAVAGQERAVEAIRNFEKELLQVSGMNTMEKQYDFTITNINNIHYRLRYSLNVNKQEGIQVNLAYDRGIVKNEIEVISTVKENKTFDEMRFDKNRQEQWMKIINYVTDSKQENTVLACGDKFNAKGPIFEQRKKALGHYGMSTDKISKTGYSHMMITGYTNHYTVQYKYQTTLSSAFINESLR